MNGTTKAPSRDAKLMITTDKNPNPHAEKDTCTINSCGRLGGLMVSALDFEASGPGSSPDRGHCVVFLGKIYYSHSASLHPGV